METKVRTAEDWERMMFGAICQSKQREARNARAKEEKCAEGVAIHVKYGKCGKPSDESPISSDQ